MKKNLLKVTLIITLSILSNVSFSQVADSTAKVKTQSSGFKGFLERRQQRLERTSERVEDAEQIRQKSIEFDYLKLENNQFYFERVYDYDSLSANEIEKMLIVNIPTLKDIKDFQSNQTIITAKIDGAKIDYKKYGGSMWNVPNFLNFKLYGNVSIIWKSKKFRVTVTNMVFLNETFNKNTNQSIFALALNEYSATQIFTKNNGAEMKTNKKLEESGNYIQKYN